MTLLKWTLPAAIWNWLYQSLARFKMPEKIGKTKYEDDVRTQVTAECAQALLELKKRSYWAQKIGPRARIQFGDKEDWASPGATYLEHEDTGDQRMLGADESLEAAERDGWAQKTALKWEHVGAAKDYTLEVPEVVQCALMWMAVIGSRAETSEEMGGGQQGKGIMWSHQTFSNDEIASYLMPFLQEAGLVEDYREALGLPRKSKLSKSWKTERPEVDLAAPKPGPALKKV